MRVIEPARVAAGLSVAAAETVATSAADAVETLMVSGSTHDHDWRQRAVLHEDGYATVEYGCVGCGGVTFR